jgi:adenylate cyclase
LFEVQDRIAQEVVNAIAPHVRERELKRALKKHPQNMTAYDLVLQALGLLYQLDYATFSRARGLLQRAMVTDPTYAPAFAYAACWHSYRVGQGWSPDPGMDAAEAMRLASAAIERDSNDALALAYYGHFQSFLMRSFSTGADIIDRALPACPNLAVAWTMSSATLGYLGQGLEAILRAETGLRLSPLNPHVFWHEHVLSQAHYINGNFISTAISKKE